MKVKSYKDLKVWQKGIEIVDKAYVVTEKFPKKEIYSLASQTQRSAVSIPSNIAEGFMRQHTQGIYAIFIHSIRFMRRTRNTADNCE